MPADSEKKESAVLSDIPGPTEGDHPRPSKPVNKSRAWRNVGLIFLCFVASFLGAWVFIQSGLANLANVTNITERQKLVDEGNAVAEVAREVSPSVVSIVTESTARTYFGPAEQEGAGTGIIISKDGYILTNRHVIPDNATKVRVVLSDGTTYNDVKVVGRDSINDLAFLKISGAKDLTAAKLGNSSDVQVGSRVIAIGNALGQYQTSVTSGIISALGRPLTATSQNGDSAESLENLMQTDAAINPGNSGGPLVSINGEVIGINTAIASDGQSIGFAIPIDDAKGLIKSVIESGELKRAYLGVRYVSITPDVVNQLDLSVKQGAYVSDSQDAVIPGSPAAKAGLKAKDIITKVNGVNIDAQHPLVSQLSQFAPGDVVTLTVLRGDQTLELKATLEQYKS